jgi:2-polyprenyl-3-methyl-5-hydroxy-6-metoxy-1,4-benzoquinol methylase
MDRESHWENAYHTKPATEMSWFEAEPKISLDLIHSVAPAGGRIIDVGGGASALADHLVAAGIWDVTVLDVSSAALALAQARLGEQARRVQWLQADITEVQPLGTFDVWHDRAVFHFLVSPEDRAAYLARLNDALCPGAHVILGTFALAGPEICSGLPVCRYDAQSLAATLGSGYSLVQHLEHTHVTPSGMIQLFTFCTFQKAHQ